MFTTKVKQEILKWADYFTKIMDGFRMKTRQIEAQIAVLGRKVDEVIEDQTEQSDFRRELDALYKHLGVEFIEQKVDYELTMTPEHFEKVKKGKKQ